MPVSSVAGSCNPSSPNTVSVTSARSCPRCVWPRRTPSTRQMWRIGSSGTGGLLGGRFVDRQLDALESARIASPVHVLVEVIHRAATVDHVGAVFTVRVPAVVLRHGLVRPALRARPVLLVHLQIVRHRRILLVVDGGYSRSRAA